MGFPTLATKGLKPFMQAALEQKVVKRWMFAFYLGKSPRLLSGGASLPVSSTASVWCGREPSTLR